MLSRFGYQTTSAHKQHALGRIDDRVQVTISLPMKDTAGHQNSDHASFSNDDGALLGGAPL